MSDMFDRAAEIEERDRAAAINNVCKNLYKAGTDDCVVCGDEIPKQRREKVPYATRCVDCQTEFEAQKARAA